MDGAKYTFAGKNKDLLFLTAKHFYFVQKQRKGNINHSKNVSDCAATGCWKLGMCADEKDDAEEEEEEEDKITCETMPHVLATVELKLNHTRRDYLCNYKILFKGLFCV